MSFASKKFFGMAILAAVSMVPLLAIMLSPVSADAHSDKSGGSKVEIVMTEGGNALVRGAKVTSVSGSVINAQTVLGSATLNWIVTTGSETKFYNARGGDAALSSIATGDTVSFAGALGTSGSSFTVSANAVKDWTPVASEGNASGLVTSIDSANSRLVIDKKNGKGEQKLLTVQFNASTTVSLNGSPSTFGAIQTGDGLKVSGILSADGSVLTASTVAASRPAQIEDKKFSRLFKSWFNGKAFLNW